MTRPTRLLALCLGSLLAVSTLFPTTAIGAENTDQLVATQHQNLAIPSSNNSGWRNGDDPDARRWYDNGVMATSKEFFDPGSQSWYWADADGSIAHDKDVFQRSNGGKWVRYNHSGHMIKGEDFRYSGWYLFNNLTGAMLKGMQHVGSNGGKWVYYDKITGKMAHGEQYVNYDAAHTGWYLFDNNTGAMFHGDTFVRSNGGKWVRYDGTSGKMVYGLQRQDGAYYYFDTQTGKMAHGKTYVPDWRGSYWFNEVTGRSEGVYYENCEAVRRAGKAPLHREQPGYRNDLDRDRDGVACEG